MTFAPASQFHICLQYLGEGLSRVLLRVCDIFVNLRFQLSVCSIVSYVPGRPAHQAAEERGDVPRLRVRGHQGGLQDGAARIHQDQEGRPPAGEKKQRATVRKYLI